MHGDASSVRHSRAGVFDGEYWHFDARASSLRQDRFDAVQAIVGLARSKRHLRTRIWETFWGGSAQNRLRWTKTGRIGSLGRGIETESHNLKNNRVWIERWRWGSPLCGEDPSLGEGALFEGNETSLGEWDLETGISLLSIY